MNENHVKKSINKNNKKRKEWHLYKNILLFIKDPLPDSIDVKAVIAKIEHCVPYELARHVDEIFVGQFPQLFNQKQINATFKDGAIYCTNEQVNDDDMVDDIVHELAHAVEENMQREIYSDGMLEREFLSKRKWLFNTLESHGYVTNDQMSYFVNPDYVKKFDLFLYKNIGYDKLSVLTANVFMSPYAITCLREYFADGFEEYFMKRNFKKLKEISPVLFEKFENILEEKDGF